MVFICTCSQDATVDILSPLLGDVFRFNIDKRQDYSWDFSKENFKLTNLKTREKIDSTSFSSFYLRSHCIWMPLMFRERGVLRIGVERK